MATIVKKSWEPMVLSYEGDVSALIRMPGNGKTHVGQDPGDFLQPPGLHKKPGCETGSEEPPGHVEGCP
ncbi:MAG: hypothetical protein M3265_11060 [Actinomycetota bacterium]|nr:hypothetical protein [Actinomycetota bacterium]